MEQHGDELNDKDEREEEYEDETYRFELEVLLRDVHLKERTALHLFKTIILQ